MKSTPLDHTVKQSVLPLIVKLSHETFSKMPYSERLGLSVEDLVEEGKLLTFTKIATRYSNKYNATFFTFAYRVLTNHYKGILRASNAQKRRSVLYSLQYEYTTSSGRTETLLDRCIRRQGYRMENHIISRVDAERAFLRAYAGAGRSQRKFLIRWLLCPANTQIKNTVEAQQAILYIRKSFTREMCRTLHRDHECRKYIADSIVSRFFTPLSDTYTSDADFSFRKTVEYGVMSALSPMRRASVEALI